MEFLGIDFNQLFDGRIIKFCQHNIDKIGEYMELPFDKEENQFKYDTIRFLSSKKQEVFSFIINGCYIHNSFISKFTNTRVLNCGYFNDKENVNDHDVYHFFQKIHDFIVNWCVKNHKPVSKKLIISSTVPYPEQGYRYFPVYPSTYVKDKCKSFVKDYGNYTVEISVMIIKHGNFYIPMFILNDIYIED